MSVFVHACGVMWGQYQGLWCGSVVSADAGSNNVCVCVEWVVWWWLVDGG